MKPKLKRVLFGDRWVWGVLWRDNQVFSVGVIWQHAWNSYSGLFGRYDDYVRLPASQP